MKNIELNLIGKTLKFEIIPIEIKTKNIENIFSGNNKKTLRYYLDKSIDELGSRKSSHPLKNKVTYLREKYQNELDMKLGDFLLKLKTNSSEDLPSFLNTYGDKKFCNYKINSNLLDKGIYCYIIENKIMYIGRCRKTFKERINNDYGKITPYNCLIDGQATNCHINSLVNSGSEENEIFIGIYSMGNSSNEEIIGLEKLILSQHEFEWNIQTS